MYDTYCSKLRAVTAGQFYKRPMREVWALYLIWPYLIYTKLKTYEMFH